MTPDRAASVALIPGIPEELFPTHLCRSIRRVTYYVSVTVIPFYSRSPLPHPRIRLGRPSHLPPGTS